MNALHRRATLVTTMAIMLLPWAASAQTGGSAANDQQNGQQNDQVKRQQNQRRFAMLAQKLNLTDDQKKQFMQINRETAQKVRAARKDDSLSEEQMQAQLKEIHKQHNQQVFAILTPEQQAELKAFWEEMRKKQQSDNSSDNSSANPGSQATDNSNNSNKEEEDLFAGMVPDPDPAPQPAPKKKAAAPK